MGLRIELVLNEHMLLEK